MSSDVQRKLWDWLNQRDAGTLLARVEKLEGLLRRVATRSAESFGPLDWTEYTHEIHATSAILAALEETEA